jgi:hypothetical protein
MPSLAVVLREKEGQRSSKQRAGAETDLQSDQPPQGALLGLDEVLSFVEEFGGVFLER